MNFSSAKSVFNSIDSRKTQKIKFSTSGLDERSSFHFHGRKNLSVSRRFRGFFFSLLLWKSQKSETPRFVRIVIGATIFGQRTWWFYIPVHVYTFSFCRLFVVVINTGRYPEQTARRYTAIIIPGGRWPPSNRNGFAAIKTPGGRPRETDGPVARRAPHLSAFNFNGLMRFRRTVPGTLLFIRIIRRARWIIYVYWVRARIVVETTKKIK